jgi:ketosteroid isomerase-like protein
MRTHPLALALLVAGCAPSASLSPEALRAAEQVLEDYRAAWLAQDSARVLSHVSDDFSLLAPGSTVSGKERIRTFWFPGGDTVYPIRKYEISNQLVYGAGDFAIAQGLSSLAWDTRVKDSILGSASSNTEYLTVQRNERGQWRIYRQIYVMR